MIKIKVGVALDGRAPVMLQEVLEDQAAVLCPRCGYALKGLETVNGEIKCPECGRHTPEDLLR